MASAFTKPKYKSTIKHTKDNYGSKHSDKRNTTKSRNDCSVSSVPIGVSYCESEPESTEDEEVKLNCTRGIQAHFCTYDSTSSGDYDEDSSVFSSSIGDVSVLSFVSGEVQQQSMNLHKPVPLYINFDEGCSEERPISSNSSISSHDSEAKGYEASVSDDESIDSDEEESSIEEYCDDSESECESSLASEPSAICVPSVAKEDNCTIDEETTRERDFSTDFSIDTADPPFLFQMEMAFSGEYGKENEFPFDFSSDDDSSSVFENEIVRDVEQEPSTTKRRSLSPAPNSEDSFSDSSKRLRYTEALSGTSVVTNNHYRQMDGVISPISEEGEAVDNRMRDELRESDLIQVRESTPVPLISPPPSPLRVESDQGPTTVCEWPCNLVIDNALTAVRRMRAPSPDTLSQLEAEEEQRFSALLKNDHHQENSLMFVAPL
mmetsp:Transcript_25098/g.35772  ORF Transcript_25098/g.35772 Transcript_25098/m.35772 type:complete len:434 (+) Transcript_25098:123-1424(+)|eukprot:CAMPEP_0202443222 /NCGR_PEP_ID=MMETSP1360-20130828/2570_1 /ASSEMBLY_ACC=CAM_ASM_000848 /TAXON_ID=515479 /ORGANISM="Licmophora paradoxa, Strain CCMP2313" /LENGTH=433 /DNA_ID=CAMNT_0049058865 /DNA_START=102 /DNA_END=1403 /DNA_ORIENTATION=+